MKWETNCAPTFKRFPTTFGWNENNSFADPSTSAKRYIYIYIAYKCTIWIIFAYFIQYRRAFKNEPRNYSSIYGNKIYLPHHCNSNLTIPIYILWFFSELRSFIFFPPPQEMEYFKKPEHFSNLTFRLWEIASSRPFLPSSPYYIMASLNRVLQFKRTYIRRSFNEITAFKIHAKMFLSAAPTSFKCYGSAQLKQWLKSFLKGYFINHDSILLSLKNPEYTFEITISKFNIPPFFPPYKNINYHSEGTPKN